MNSIPHKVSGETKPLLIVAEDIDGEALATLIVNKMRGTIDVVAVKAPDFGDRRTMALEDLATVTGGQVISKDKGHKLDKLQPLQYSELLGRARTVNVTKEKTTVVDGKGTEDAISQKSLEIKVQLDKASSAFEKEKLQDRLGKLVGGVAIINVGGNSEIEIKEKKDRVEDALFATKAALDEGIIVGGGTAFLQASKRLDKEMNIKCGVIHLGTVKPLDEATLLQWIPKVKKIVTVEENVLAGGFGSSILEFTSDHFPENSNKISRKFIKGSNTSRSIPISST